VIIAGAIANASKGAANEVAFNNYAGNYFLPKCAGTATEMPVSGEIEDGTGTGESSAT
jgi:hypothetical protein